MDRQKKKDYAPPVLTAVTFKMERGFAGSGPLFGAFSLGNSYSTGGDAWDGSNTTGGNRFGGGWYDNGESAWGN